MKFVTIATIDGKMFRNMETSARDIDRAELIAKTLLKNKYVGEIEIIRTVEKSAWNKLLKSIKS